MDGAILNTVWFIGAWATAWEASALTLGPIARGTLVAWRVFRGHAPGSILWLVLVAPCTFVVVLGAALALLATASPALTLHLAQSQAVRLGVLAGVASFVTVFVLRHAQLPDGQVRVETAGLGWLIETFGSERLAETFAARYRRFVQLGSIWSGAAPG